MNIKINKTFEVNLCGIFYKKDDTLTTHETDPGEWYGNDICEKVDFNKIMMENLADGEYEFELTIKKV